MDLQQLLTEKFGYETFREGQQDIIESVLSGHDTLAILPTGMGKSLCYQLPGYVVEGTTLIISPLLSLMQDQVEQLKQFGQCAGRHLPLAKHGVHACLHPDLSTKSLISL